MRGRAQTRKIIEVRVRSELRSVFAVDGGGRRKKRKKKEEKTKKKKKEALLFLLLHSIRN